jgi:hypothetical protein
MMIQGNMWFFLNTLYGQLMPGINTGRYCDATPPQDAILLMFASHCT